MSVHKVARQINAVVVSAGLMEKTVKVRIGVQKWNSLIRKHFNRHTHLLVHDPRSSVRLGDIIAITPGFRASKNVHHVVSSIIAPFGEHIESRPPVPSEEERLEERASRKAVKDERRRMRRQSAVGGESVEGMDREVVLKESAETKLAQGQVEVNGEVSKADGGEETVFERLTQKLGDELKVEEKQAEEIQEEKGEKKGWWR